MELEITPQKKLNITRWWQRSVVVFLPLSRECQHPHRSAPVV